MFFDDKDILNKFDYTEWSQQASVSNNDEFKSFMKNIAECCQCQNLIVNTDLEDAVRGFGTEEQDNSQDKYYPLKVCMKCLEEEKGSFIYCKKCSDSGIYCKTLGHGQATARKPIQHHLFNLLKTIKYRCHFCTSDPSEEIKKEDEKFYSPIELRAHWMNDC